MDQEIQDLEKQLLAMRPARLAAGLRMQIERSLIVTSSRATEQSDPIASTLQSSAPAGLSAELSGRLEEILSRIPHPQTGKLVHFPDTPTRTHSTSAWRRFAAVAAVALFGSITALMVPEKAATDGITAIPQPSTKTAAPETATSGAVVPAGFHTGLSEARDEGIIWQDSVGPQRMLKLVYRDNVTMRDSSGRIYQVERPRVKYILVPAKVD